MRTLLLLLVLCWHFPTLAVECPIYLYIDQSNQDPVGLFKLDSNSERTLRGQIPETSSGKLCWYTSPDGTVVAQRSNPDKAYIFIRRDGHWTFSETRDLISISGHD